MLSQPMPSLANGQPSPGVQLSPALPPLNVSGLVVTRADLVAALRIYLPALADVTVLDADRFILRLGSTPGAAEGSQA